MSCWGRPRPLAVLEGIVRFAAFWILPMLFIVGFALALLLSLITLGSFRVACLWNVVDPLYEWVMDD
jgi:hypothetical protein